ncbi:MAG TPA: formate dehydrogenase subunit delta [Rudaea sp.]|nr:formate dehydrogenase subunit delta [Rudaea sp.]
MSAEHLVRMANDIADFFHSEPDHAAGVEGVLNHLRRFWDPRMRRKIVAHWREHGGEGLQALAREAVEKLAASEVAA